MILYACIGVKLAEVLCQLPHLVTYKIGNVLGYVMTVLGIIVLSEVVVNNERYKVFIIKHVAGHFFLALVFIIGAAMFYSEFLASGPSAIALEEFVHGPAIFFMMLTMVFSNLAIEGVDSPLPWSKHTSLIAFGGYLTIVGTMLQGYAAVRDLLS